MLMTFAPWPLSMRKTNLDRLLRARPIGGIMGMLGPVLVTKSYARHACFLRRD
jgi:hypothetical protein